MPSPRPFAAFYFDCDSTLSRIEGVDELTRKLPEAEREALRALTHAAMEGERPLAEIYEERLHVLAPTAAELEAVGDAYVAAVVPDAAATIAALRHLGKHVGIISGGLLQPVAAFARALGVEAELVHAVPIRFDAQGSYAGFDHDSPLWRNQGKVEVVAALPDAHRPLVFVGDGVTDLETKPVADLFVGFGGIERRARVAAEADVYVTAPRLAAILEFTLTEIELALLAGDPRFADLLD